MDVFSPVKQSCRHSVGALGCCRPHTSSQNRSKVQKGMRCWLWQSVWRSMKERHSRERPCTPCLGAVCFPLPLPSSLQRYPPDTDSFHLTHLSFSTLSQLVSASALAQPPPHFIFVIYVSIVS